MKTLRREINKLLQETYYQPDDGEADFDPYFEPGVLDKIERAVLDLVERAKPNHPDTPTDAWSTGFITAIDDYHANLVSEVNG
jgi:hypothetical protein